MEDKSHEDVERSHSGLNIDSCFKISPTVRVWIVLNEVCGLQTSSLLRCYITSRVFIPYLYCYWLCSFGSC